ncbi:hypothetical protein AB0I60_14165 [Actinosynnema sp. NPDC050436]|uniref:hypothetical protein n=1 Tax=Actinosynnema sp. NPDC050436 TaxID=3155659 RepID=UPI0033C86387
MALDLAARVTPALDVPAQPGGRPAIADLADPCEAADNDVVDRPVVGPLVHPAPVPRRENA